MIKPADFLSIGTLFRRYWINIFLTWGLTICETGMMALLPLLLGRSIDGLLAHEFAAFNTLLTAMIGVVFCIILRRVYDTRTYGTMRAEICKTLIQRNSSASVSARNARVLMGRELVNFLEFQAPHCMMSAIRVVVSIAILFSFHIALALSATIAMVIIIFIYSLFAQRFFLFNSGLNTQSEMQVSAIEGDDMSEISSHFQSLRQHEVRISDLESLVYGLIFSTLLSMLAFNVWFSTTEKIASPGQIFSVVMYSYQFVDAAISLPYTLQVLTRLKEITARINQAPV